MDALAARMAEALNYARPGPVIVFDFAGPNGEVTALGKALAEDFRAPLVKSATRFQVQSRSGISRGMTDLRFGPQFMNDPASMLIFAQHLHVKAFVMGELSIAEDTVSLTVSSFRVRDGKALKTLRAVFPATEQTKELAARDLMNDSSVDDLAAFPKAMKNGYSTATCLICTRPSYPPEAMEKRIQGKVILEAIIGTDGKVHQVKVLKALPGGLTEAAIKQARQWDIKPATGPDGKPAAVRQLIEIQFQIFR